jgi:hypothetical protein
VVFNTRVPEGDCTFLIANVTPPSSTGTVQFNDKFKGDTIALGDAVQVRPGGLAVQLTKTLAKGEHALTATFTPKDPMAFKPSMSDVVRVKSDAS